MNVYNLSAAGNELVCSVLERIRHGQSVASVSLEKTGNKPRVRSIGQRFSFVHFLLPPKEMDDALDEQRNEQKDLLHKESGVFGSKKPQICKKFDKTTFLCKCQGIVVTES